MDVAYINPFLTATANLFETMIKVPLKLGKPSLRRPEDRMHKLYQISAAIDLTMGVEGRIVLSFSAPVAFALAGALAGKVFNRVDADLLDAMGEIANMIVGGARTTMPNAGTLRISTPSMMATHQVIFPVNTTIIIIPFDTAAGRFIIETALRVTKATAA